MPVKKKQFTVILEPEVQGGYSVYCPALPGCVSQGDDRNSALNNIQEAILLALEEFENMDPAAFSANAVETADGIQFPPSETPKVVLDEIEAIMQAQIEDGLPVRMEIEQVEVNSPVSA